jgi:hypothetical protein
MPITIVSTPSTEPRRHTALWFACAFLTALIPLILAASLAGTAYGNRFQARAHSARTLNVTDTAHVHLVSETESGELVEEGEAKGALPGTVRVQFSIAATINATFTIRNRYGSLSGRGSGAIHGTGMQASFGGSMSVTRGTGRYAHAHGHGGFYGTIDRENTHYPAVVQTTGTLTYQG